MDPSTKSPSTTSQTGKNKKPFPWNLVYERRFTKELVLTKIFGELPEVKKKDTSAQMFPPKSKIETPEDQIREDVKPVSSKLYPKRCAHCQSEDASQLKPCGACKRIWYCCRLTQIKHVVKFLGIIKRTTGLLTRSLAPFLLLDTPVEKFTKVRNWDEYFALRPLPEPSREVDMAAYKRLYTDIMCESLTVFHCLNECQILPDTKDIVIHLLGAEEHTEARCAGERFRELMNLLPGYTVRIVMVGPAISTKRNGKKEDFFEKRLTVCYISGYYHEYIALNPKDVPHVAIAFNSQIHQTTWPQTIAYLCKKRIPACFTDVDQIEHEFSMQVALMNFRTRILFGSKNNFGSQHMQNDPWQPNRVYSSSQYVYAILGFRDDHEKMPSY